VNTLRSLLFVPGNKDNMLEKALNFKPDIFIPDMEDSVPTGEKENARNLIAKYLPKLAKSGVPIIPRVNSLDTEWAVDDMTAVVGPYIYGISIGKINSPADIKRVSEHLSILERKAGLNEGHIKMIPWLESAKAIIHCYEICLASKRLVGVAFGGEDFTHDMGIGRLEDESEVSFARNQLCIAARAAEIPALDTPYFLFKNEDGLRTNSLIAKQYGFKGKFAIHPAQIDGINDAFSPSEEEIKHAHRVVKVFEEAERTGRGSTSLDGKVIDVPVVKRARALLDFASRQLKL
jgi:citrate lyase subunit beta/citryl-CoA lyase